MPAQGPGGNFNSAFQSFLSSVTAKTSSTASSSSAKSTSSAAQTSSTDAATSTDASDTISTSIALGVSTTATLTDTSAAATSDAATITSDPATATSSLDSAASSSLLSTSSADQDTSAAAIATTPTSTALSSFATSTTQPTANAASTSASLAVNTALPETVDAHHSSGLSGGALAAAVLVPVLLALFALVLAFLCLRRRRKQQDPDHASPAFLPTMQEKLGFRSHVTPPSPSAPTALAAGAAVAPVLTSHRNNAYYTGLDTSSHGSERGHSGEYYAPVRRSDGGTFAEPPPPYKTKSLGTNSARDSVQSAIGGVGKAQTTSAPISSTPPRLPPIAITSAGYPLLRASSPPPAGNGRPDSDTFPSAAAVLSPFEDPPSPTTLARSHDTVTPASALLSPTSAATTAAVAGVGTGAAAAAAAAAAARPATSRSTTATADTEPYRDDDAAEVHVGQAQAVRMSMLQPTVRRYSGGTMLSDVSGRDAYVRGVNANGGRPVSDPFADGDGASMTDGGRVSPVSSLGSEGSSERGGEKWNGWRISR